MQMSRAVYEQFRVQVKQEILQKLDCGLDFSDGQVRRLIDERLCRSDCIGRLDVVERRKLGRELFAAIRGFDVLQELLEDKRITEIMVNGPDRIFIEKDGRLTQWQGRFESPARLLDVIQQIAAGCNRVVNEASPILDARLSDGSRVNVVLSPVALNGPAMTIRRFPEEGMTLDRLVALGSITEECKSFLELLVKCRYNIFISGGTGSGKTTFLNALSQAIPPEERIVTIEDSAELQLKYAQNLVSLETRNANMEGCRTISVRDLIRSSLRMRPDRIIVGEVRGAEICELLTAYNSGHAGSMSTGHGNTARDMLLRMETMLLMGMDIPLSAIRRQIASGIDILVHLGRMRDKTRKVLEIAEITGFSEGEITTRTLYAFEEDENSTREKVSGKLERKENFVMWKSWKRRDLAENKTDYSKYRFSWQEYLLCFFKAFFATGAFTGMFYRSWLGMLAFPAVWKVLYGRDKKNRIQKRKERLSLQFKDTILMVTAGIQAGSSIENAFLDVEREIGVLYGQNSEMGQELALIRKGLTNRVALEQMLLDFGRRSGIEEIRDFTEVFATARHLGGNLKEMIQRTADLTGQRMETQRDIATMLASRKYEQKVMMLIPFLLYGYMQVSSKGFFDGLYHNPAGIAIMTVCLGLYLASCVLAEKIMDIRA
ncbi:MAG: ATPase, T2SS/T4P/T4SS family [Gallintestinimicrobium sp.]